MDIDDLLYCDLLAEHIAERGSGNISGADNIEVVSLDHQSWLF